MSSFLPRVGRRLKASVSRRRSRSRAMTQDDDLILTQRRRAANRAHKSANDSVKSGDLLAERTYLETEELHLRQLLEQHPEDGATWSALIRAGERLHRADREQRDLVARMHRSMPDRSEPYREAGRLWAKSDPERSLLAWGEAHRLDPTHIGTVVHLARARVRTGRVEEAVELCASYVETHPKNPKLARAYAAALARLTTDADKERAHAAWLEALRLEPEHVGSVVQLARVKTQTGRVQEAEELCARYLKSYPEHLELARAYASANQGLGSLQLVEELTIKQLKLQPSDPATQQRVGALAIDQIRVCIQDVSAGGKDASPISVEARSQFMREPAKSLAPWRESLIFRELDSVARRDAVRSSLSQPKETGREQRILFISDNWNFMRGLVDWFDISDSYQVRTLEPFDLDPDCRPGIRQIVGQEVAEECTGLTRDEHQLPRDSYVGRLIEWADVIFVEWCNYSAAWLTWLAEADARIVVRLHSYEAYKYWPHLVNWGKVDTLITVAPQMRRFLGEQVDLVRYGVTSVTLPNYNDLRSYDLAKSKRPYKSLGLVGYSNANKNPLMALEILNRLVQDDSAWRLILIGRPWPAEIPSDHEREYHERFKSFMRTNDLEQNIDVRDFTYALHEEFVDIDYILSTSDREGTHETVIQGMGSGAIPVVRNWPMVKEWGGSHSLYDSDFVFETVEDAVKIIQDTERIGSRAYLQARTKKLAFENFHSENVMPKYERALRGLPEL